jgi:CHAT domain-containing protein
MVRLSRSASWLCSIALITTAISLPEQTAAQVTAPSFQATLAQAKQQYRQADFRRAIASYQQILSSGTATDRVEALLQLAEMDLWMQKRPIAETKIQQALKLAKETGNKQGEGRSLSMLAAVERYRENYAKATELLNQALPMLQGDREGEARVYLQFGIIDHAQKQFPQALEKFQTALKTAEAGNHQDVMANCYDWLAETQRSLKKIPQAEVLIQQQQELSRSIDYRLGEYDGLNTVINLQNGKQQFVAANGSRQRQLEIMRSAGNVWFQIEVLSLIGFDLQSQANDEKKQSNYEQAEKLVFQSQESFHQARDLVRKIADPERDRLTWIGTKQGYAWMGFINISRSDTYEGKKDYVQAETAAINARKAFEQALEIARDKLRDRTAEGEELGHLAQAYMSQAGVAYKMGRYQEQLSYNLEALKLSKQSLELIEAGNPAPAELKSPKNLVALAHLVTLSSYNSTEQYEKAIEFGRAAQLAAKETGNPETENNISLVLHSTYQSFASVEQEKRRYPEAIAAAQEAIKYAKLIKNSDNEIRSRINLIAMIYVAQGKFDRTLEEATQTLERSREVSNASGMVQSMMTIALAHKELGNYPQALDFYQQALALSEKDNRDINRPTIINNIAAIYAEQGNYAQAKTLLQKSSDITRNIWEQYNQGVTAETIQALCLDLPYLKKSYDYCQNPGKLPTGNDLNQFKYLIDSRANFGRSGMGIGYQNKAALVKIQGDHQTGLQLNQKALEIFTELKDSNRIASVLIGMAASYSELGDYQKAYDLSQQALKIAQDNHNPTDEIDYNQQLGIIELSRGNLESARKFLDRALTLAREIKAPLQESLLLGVMAQYHRFGGNYTEALNLNQQALKRQETMGIKPAIVSTLMQLGEVYTELGDYQQANNYHQQSLKLAQSIGNQPSEIYSTLKLAESQLAAKQFDSAKLYFQKTLQITQKIGLQREQGSALSGLGAVELAQSRPSEAISFLQQALVLQRKVGVKPRQAMSLNRLGQAQTQLKQSPSSTLQEALALARQVSDRPTEAQVLANLAVSLTPDQPELAIALYKKSISIYEDIRKGLAPLPQEQQKAYTESIAKTYRELADLLLKNDRILEAQQILDLLKLQELNDYLRNVRGGTQTITFRKAETEILAKFNNSQTPVNQLMQRLAELQTKPTLTPQETTELNKLYQLQKDLTFDINKFFQENPEVQALRKQLRIEATVPDPDLLLQLQSKLAQTKNAAIFYPAIFDDRLELILITADAPPLRRTVPLKKADLNRGVNDLLSALSDPQSQPKAPAQQLYQWLIAPLEPDLKAANITTLIYAPDSNLRYIPLAALHDGTQWLTQRYRFNIITATSITNLDPKPLNPPKILAGAISSNAEQNYTVGNATFNGLPHAKEEVENIAAIVPNTNQFIDRAFDLTTLESRFNGYNILHFATHGYFDIETQEKSFLLFGGQTNGQSQIATLADINNWRLSKVDLVVLSACQTGISDRLPSQKGDGKEILGLGYQFQKSGAKATLSSLWRVSDQGTQILMAAFYKHLTTGKLSTIAALQQAQTDMIESDRPRLTQLNQNRALTVHQPQQSPAAISDKPLSHPYYWAPFILIGNGL